MLISSCPQSIIEQGEAVELTQGNYQTFIRSASAGFAKRPLRPCMVPLDSGTRLLRHLQPRSKLIFSTPASATMQPARACSGRYNIPVSVYDNLITTVREHTPLLDRYMRLRKRILNLDELHMYDLYTPIVKETTDEITYEEARDILLLRFHHLVRPTVRF